MTVPNRRQFINTSSAMLASFAASSLLSSCSGNPHEVGVYGHLWVYASAFPPNWDCTPNLETVFQDFKAAGIEGIEVMEVHLRNDEMPPKAEELIERYGVPITGTSYSAAMWKKEEQNKILDDAALVLQRLQKLGGKTFGITVGDARRPKTDAELDAQAELLHKLLPLCAQHNITPNLHNHTFELAYDQKDLLGTLERVPELKLGSDLSWLHRGGVDPVAFVEKHADRFVYLHIRDNDLEGNFTEAVGEGVIDFPAIAKILNERNFAGPVAIELAYSGAATRSHRENWQRSRDYVRNTFGW